MKTLRINGVLRDINYPDGDKTLLAFLRENLGLTGTKAGCGIGVCGSCTVLAGGRPVRSCVTPVSQIIGQEILTIEGMETLPEAEEGLHPVQRAFLEAGAVQCGFCTPGMILTSYALLKTDPEPDRSQIREALKNNLCRCTGYQQIVDAVQLAGTWMKNRTSGKEHI